MNKLWRKFIKHEWLMVAASFAVSIGAMHIAHYLWVVGPLLLAAPTVLGSTLDTGNIEPTQRVVNMDDVIHDLDPQATALTALLMKLRKEQTINPQFQLLEDEYAPKDTTANGAFTNVAGTITVAAGTGTYFRPFDIIHIPETLELMLVTSIATDVLTVTRGYGETAGTAGSNGTDVRIIGNALMEGDNMPQIRTTKVINQNNYTEIFREPIGATETELNSATYGNMSLNRLRNKHAIEHMMAIERAFWWGERKEDLTGAKPRRTTRGVFRWLLAAGSGAQALDGGAVAITEANLESWFQNLFRYGNSTKFIFCSRLALTEISAFARAKLFMFPEDQVYGIQIMTYQSPHGTGKLVVNNLFTGTQTDKRWSGWMVGLDLADLAFVVMRNRDTKLYLNRQAPDVDGEIDEYITEAGLKLIHARHHGYYKNFI